MSGSRDAASQAQVRAARPDASTWLAANAGSGKTRVLTDRVARLLLGGTQPQRILCLTYTKAAAAEMQNRLFARLGAWAMLDDAELRGALVELGHEGALDNDVLRAARTLFARAIETPGGLKIQTIHAFCAGLLRRFPLEAGVSPQFSEIEDRAAARLRSEIVDDFAAGAQAGLVRGLADHLSDNDFDAITAAIAQRAAEFADHGGREAICTALGIPPDLTRARVIAGVFTGGEPALLAALQGALAAGSKMDLGALEKLQKIDSLDFAALPVLESVFLTASGPSAGRAKIGKFPTKATQGRLGADQEALNDLMARVEAARPLRLAIDTAEKAQALHDFALPFLAEYARRKQLRGWLDFDDLIAHSRGLLNDPTVAAWVLYRLDGGIDHILVDEAQDTSPAQWDVIDKLAQEFTSGIGARADAERTIFVVGDKKQSIYSFQGADPRAFDKMQSEFSERLRASGRGLASLSLEYSFRSAAPILRLVDAVFAGQADAGFAADGLHRAFKEWLPGRVDLWPLVPPAETEEETPWNDPVDRRSPRHHTVILASQIARALRQMIAAGTLIPSGKPGKMRRLRAGDVLILVQRRSELFAEIIRACKAEGLPIAGADRLKVGAELAVRDLAALLRFLATPEDDLSLATAMRSPLLGWSERALYALAQPRGDAFLWEALRNAAAAHPRTMAMLDDLRGQTDFLRPFELIERILTRHDGRRLLLGRLGAEAEDGIDALLSQALAYERTEVPSLTGFLGWMQDGDLEIKRQMGGAGDMVRVMTVHGAKGLESPVVILPDTARRRAPQPGALVRVGDTPMWSAAEAQMPEAMKTARDIARQRQVEERQRLLYVAMTRAETWLIVAAAGTLDKEGDSWYQQVEAGLKGAGAQDHVFRSGPGLRYQDGLWEGTIDDPAPQDTAEPSPLPEFFRCPPPEPLRQPDTLGPSELGGAKALPGEDGQESEAATLRGTRIHALLEHLPTLDPQQWAMAAPALIGLDDADCAPLLSEAEKVLTTHPGIFSLGTLAEVAVTAQIGPRRIHGVIDRLTIAPDAVCAIDFKTNAVLPGSPAQCPEGLLRQMGAYAHALAQVYPGRRIDTAILWTRNAVLMPLPHDIVSPALWRAPLLDVAGPGS